jgi:hypothetical protein
MDYLNKYIFRKTEDENINLNQVPYIMLSNFESLTEKQCLKADKNNDKVYKKLLEKVEKAQKQVRNTGLFLNLEAPIPPHPSNRDRFLLWKRRNVNHHVITQSESVIFLNENGYKLNEHYEAYQAIELSKEIKRNKGIPIDNKEILESKNFDNVYTTQDKNIFRRRSMYGKTQFLETRKAFNDVVINDFNGFNNDFNTNLTVEENNSDSNTTCGMNFNSNIIQPTAPSTAPSAPPSIENSCKNSRPNTTNINMYLPNTSNFDNQNSIYPSISDNIGKN